MFRQIFHGKFLGIYLDGCKALARSLRCSLDVPQEGARVLLTLCLIVVIEGTGHDRLVELIAGCRSVFSLHIVFCCVVQDRANASSWVAAASVTRLNIRSTALR